MSRRATPGQDAGLPTAPVQPELCQELRVRAAGYFGYFVPLNRALQNEVSAGTEHTLGG